MSAGFHGLVPEPLETLIAGGVPEDLGLSAQDLHEQYTVDGIPTPFSGDHITTTLAEF